MSSSRGSISILVTLGVAFLVILMQVGVATLGKSLADEEEYLRERQLRLLGISAAKKFANMDFAAGSEEICRVKLYPGEGEASVVRKNLYSSDACFKYFDIHAVQGRLSYWLRQTTFRPSAQMYELAKQYMLIYGGTFQGEENLRPEDKVYTSKEEVQFPQIDFLQRTKNKSPCRYQLDVKEAEKNGLGRMFYYLKDSSRSFAFYPYASLHGAAVIAAEKGIRIGEYCKFSDHVIFLAHGPCWIENHAELEHAVIIASGPVTIGEGCRINGVVFSSSDIILQGESTLTHDASTVAVVVSIFSLL